jgi:hypothetical protein
MNIRDLLNRLDNIAEDGEIKQNALPDDATKKAADAAIAKQLGDKKNGAETGEKKVSTTAVKPDAKSDIDQTSTEKVDPKYDKEGRLGKPVPSGYYLDRDGNLRPDWDKYWDDTGVKKDATTDVKKQSAMPNEAPKVEVNGVGQAYPPEQVAAAKVIKGYVKTIEQCKEWETYVDPKTGAISYADRPHDGDPFKHVPHNMPMDWIPHYNPDLDKAIKAIPKIVIDKKGWFGNAYEHDIDLALLQKILASAPADAAPEVPKAPVNVEKKPDDSTAKDELGDFAAQKLKDQEAREKAEADRIAKEKEKVEPEVAQSFPVKPQGDIETKELPPLDDKKQNALPSNAEKEAQIARAKKLKDMIDDYENKLHPPKESIEDLAKSLVESFGYDFVYDNLNEKSGEGAIVKPALKALIKATEEELRALTKTAEKYGGKAVDGVKGLWDDLSNAKEAAKTGYHGEPVPTGKTTKSGKPQMASQDSKAFQKELEKKSDLEKGAYKGGQTAKQVVNTVKDNPKKSAAIAGLGAANAAVFSNLDKMLPKKSPEEVSPTEEVPPKEEVPPVIDAPKEEVPPVIDAPKDNKDSKQNALPNNPSDEELAEMKAKIQKEIDELSKIEDPDVQEVVKPSKERWDKINEPKINRFTKKEK